MNSTAALQEGLRASKKSALSLLKLMADDLELFPSGEEREERIAVTIRFSPSTHAKFEALAELWNAVDRATGQKRGKKWKVSSVIVRLSEMSLSWVAGKLGGWPTNERERADFVRRAVEQAKRSK